MRGLGGPVTAVFLKVGTRQFPAAFEAIKQAF